MPHARVAGLGDVRTGDHIGTARGAAVPIWSPCVVTTMQLLMNENHQKYRLSLFTVGTGVVGE